MNIAQRYVHMPLAKISGLHKIHHSMA